MRALFVCLISLFSIVFLAGCSEEEPKVETPKTPVGGAPPMSKMPDDDVHRGLTLSNEGPSSNLAALQKAQSNAKASFQKAPKDQRAKANFVDATVKLGTANMNASELPPRVKYRAALALYREALKLDPNNKEAAKNKKLIEDIYKSMGRPIPQ